MSKLHTPYEQVPSEETQAYDDEQHPLQENSGDHMHISTGDGFEDEMMVKLPSSYHYTTSPPQDSGNDYHSPRNEAGSLSPQRLKSPISRSDKENGDTGDHHTHTIHFDYDSEEEEDLGRFSFDFNHALGIKDAHGDRGSLQNHQPAYMVPNTARFLFDNEDTNTSSRNRWTNFSNPILTPGKRFFLSIQDARIETRRKRMERLLALPDDSTIRFYTERFALCLGPWCDLLDKGYVPIILVIIIYAVTVSSLGEEHAFVRKMMLGMGIPLFVFRILWRPLCWLVHEKKLERVRVRISLCARRFLLFFNQTH